MDLVFDLDDGVGELAALFIRLAHLLGLGPEEV